MIPKEIRPLLKLLQWTRFIDRVRCGVHKMHKTYEEAALSLIDKDTETKRKKRVEQDINYDGVHPDIVTFWKGMQKECEKRNISVRAFEFVRSMDKQEYYYKTGRSKAPAGRSAHNIGGLGITAAVDIISTERAWDLTKKEWDILIAIGNEVARKKKIKIVNGSTFTKLYDPAHWELKDWRKWRNAADYCAENNIVLPDDKQDRWMKLDYINEINKKSNGARD
jgi:hypothetical protein